MPNGPVRGDQDANSRAGSKTMPSTNFKWYKMKTE